jgi:hypothetical protein
VVFREARSGGGASGIRRVVPRHGLLRHGGGFSPTAGHLTDENYEWWLIGGAGRGGVGQDDDDDETTWRRAGIARTTANSIASLSPTDFSNAVGKTGPGKNRGPGGWARRKELSLDADREAGVQQHP